ncbi:hypothetical protein O6H91_07G092100 [Diphasiastrum complanatum]|nr:hypothetical protein O6H91_07G092100 [Diphasiastrum complanatum]
MSEQSFGLDYKMVSKSDKGKPKSKRDEMHRGAASMNVKNQQNERLNFLKRKFLQATKLEISTDKNKICKPGPASIRRQISILFELVKKQEILHPLMWFMGSYAVIPTLGGSLFYYQSEFLKINSSFLGLAKMVGQAGLLAGSLAYNKLLKDIPLRKLVVSVQVLLSVCMLSDVILVKRVNLLLGIPDEYYVLGASAFVEAISQFKVLPFLVLLAKLCPAGSEGSLFAFFMSCLCLASILSGYFGVALASCLQISSDNFTHLPVGIFIQSMAALLPILWVRYLPDDTQKAIVKRKVEKVL